MRPCVIGRSHDWNHHFVQLICRNRRTLSRVFSADSSRPKQPRTNKRSADAAGLRRSRRSYLTQLSSVSVVPQIDSYLSLLYVWVNISGNRLHRAPCYVSRPVDWTEESIDATSGDPSPAHPTHFLRSVNQTRKRYRVVGKLPQRANFFQEKFKICPTITLSVRRFWAHKKGNCCCERR